MTNRAAALALAALVAVAAVLYLSALEDVPIHLHHDEIYFGINAHAIAQTLRDPAGRFMPLFFHMGDTTHLYPPVIIYVTAALLKVVPMSDAAIRVPNALVGLSCIVLMYFVARRFAPRWAALAAAAMMALTPAHFINSRIATDSLYPSLVFLAWLWALSRYLDHPSPRRLFVATTLLGLGVYTYIASVVTMPVYLAITVAAALWREPRLRTAVVAVAGFAWPLVFGAGFLAANPEVVGHLASKYDLASSGPALNPMQQLREAFTPWNVSDRLNLYGSAFAPGYLFVTGGSNLAHSTREAGVFLAPMAVFLAAGIVAIIRQPTAPGVVALAGLLAAPLASTIVSEYYAIPRMLTIVPAGVLVALIGLMFLWQAPLLRWVAMTGAFAGLGAIAIGGLYALFALVRGSFSGGAAAMILAGVASLFVARSCLSRGDWRPAIVALLLAMPAQFAWFAIDYFGDYRARSAARYEYNIRGAIEQMIALHDRTPGVPLYLNTDVLFIDGFWDYYLRLFNRPDLRGREMRFDSNNALPPVLETGTLILTDVNNRAMDMLTARPDLAQVARATDPVPGTSPPEERTSFVIFQKR